MSTSTPPKPTPRRLTVTYYVEPQNLRTITIPVHRANVLIFGIGGAVLWTVASGLFLGARLATDPADALRAMAGRPAVVGAAILGAAEVGVVEGGVKLAAEAAPIEHTAKERVEAPQVAGNETHKVLAKVDAAKAAAKVDSAKAAAKVDSAKAAAKVDSAKAAAKVDQKAAAKGEPAKSAANIDPPKSAANLDPPKSAANIDPPKSAANVDPSKHPANIDPPKSAANIDPPKSAANVDPPKSAANVDSSKYAANIDPLKAVATVETENTGLSAIARSATAEGGGVGPPAVLADLSATVPVPINIPFAARVRVIDPAFAYKSAEGTFNADFKIQNKGAVEAKGKIWGVATFEATSGKRLEIASVEGVNFRAKALSLKALQFALPDQEPGFISEVTIHVADGPDETTSTYKLKEDGTAF